jgi:ABC-2 type transport system permease protein
VNSSFVRLVLLVAQRDYLRTVRRRGFVAGTLLLPFAMIAIFAISTFASTSMVNQGGPIIVVNESSVSIVAQSTVTPNIQVISREEAEQRLESGAASEYYLVPAEWPGQPRVLVVQRDGPSGAQPAFNFARQATQQAELDMLLRIALVQESGLPPETVGQLFAPVQYESVGQSGESADEADVLAAYLVPYAFTLIFMLSIFITSGYLLQSVTEEKENRVVEILLSSVPALPLMAGKIVGLGAAGLTQVAIWVGTALVALPFINQQFELTINVSPVTLVLAVVFFTLGYLSYGALYAAVGALSPGAREAQQYASFFGFLAVIPIVLMPLILSDPNALVVLFLCVFPLTSPAATLAVIAVSEETPWLLVAVATLSQILFVILAIVVSGRIFRATVLLYGVRPSVKQITGAMFGRA